MERSRQPGPDAHRLSGRVHLARPHPDLIAIAAIGALVTLGLLNLSALGAHSLQRHQLVTVIVGGLLLLLMRRLPAARLYWFGWLCYATGVLLLLGVLVAGDTGFGARRWLSVGSFTLQPSEFAKVGVILVLAHLLGTNRAWYVRLAMALAAAAVPIALVVVEPDLSTATVLAATTAAMLVLGRIPIRALLALLGAIALVAPFALHLLQPYQSERLHSFLSGSRGGSGWTIVQAHIALAWGGLSGQSGNSLHLALAQYLPARETDLAFASLVEQRGVAAGVIAVLAAAALVWRAAAHSRRARTRGAALSAAGFAVLVGVEVSVSVAANLGLLPTAGVPFPLVSYGGTAAAVHVAMAGMVLGQRGEAERHRLWMIPTWRRIQPRLVRVAALAVAGSLLAMLGFGWRFVHKHGAELRAEGLFQMTRCASVPAARGQITDRHGVPLAVNVPGYKVIAVPGLMDRATENRLAHLMHRPVGAIKQNTDRPGTWQIVTVGTVPPAVGEKIIAAHLSGVRVVPDPQRAYPHGALLGPVLGWTGVATQADLRRWPDVPYGGTVGRAGIEQTYDPVLRGTDGEVCIYVDPAGAPLAIARTVAPVPGESLRLTLDLGLQKRFTAALAAAMRNGADLGAAVALDPRNGQVLALASVPAYDNNVFGPPVRQARLADVSRRPGSPLLNHVIQSEAPPGSTYKLAVAAADVAHHVVPPNQIVPTGGSWTLGGHVFHNWSALPPQDLRQAIAWSNDVYFYKLAWQLGPARIIAASRELGVGAPTGIDLPDEYAGYLGTPSSVSRIGASWYPGSTVLLGIGQGYLTVTPLQDARWTAGVSTGSVVTPHLGLAVGGRGNAPTSTRQTAIHWPAPARLSFAAKLGPVRDGMRSAVLSGTAQLLASLPVAAGGKTGTAEDASAPVSASDSWLSAVAPINAPVIEATAFLHGGAGAEPASEPVRAALAYFLAHQRAILNSNNPTG